MKKPSSLTPLTQAEINAVSGAGVGSLLHGIFEFTHHFMGFREFVNYTVDLYNNGCKAVDDNDHFTKFFCSACPPKDEL